MASATSINDVATRFCGQRVVARGQAQEGLRLKAYYLLDNPMQGEGKTVIYANRTIQTFLHLQAMNSKNVNLTLGEYAGRKIPELLGIPITVTV